MMHSVKPTVITTHFQNFFVLEIVIPSLFLIDLIRPFKHMKQIHFRKVKSAGRTSCPIHYTKGLEAITEVPRKRFPIIFF